MDEINKKHQKKESIDKAIQQFIGFVEALSSRNVINLAESMGLTKKEWIEIRKDSITDNHSIREELDEHFKTSHL